MGAGGWDTLRFPFTFFAICLPVMLVQTVIQVARLQPADDKEMD